MDDLNTILKSAESNEDFRDLLEKLRWAEGFKCPRCEGSRCTRIKSRGLLQCCSCRKQVSPTSGTFLHGVRNLRAWVKAILSFRQEEGQSAVAYALLLDRSYATTWFMLHKIRMVLGANLINFINQSEKVWEVPCSLLKSALFKASSEGEGEGEDTPPRQVKTLLNREMMRKACYFIAYLLGVFNGVSRKYSQLYAFEYCLREASIDLEPIDLVACFVRGSPSFRRSIFQFFSPYLLVL